MLYDVLIVGGGASGLCAAIRLKQKNRKLNVAVVEQLSRVGKKLIVTGNGRCNITNRDIELSRYHSENVAFCKYALSKYSNLVIEDFFEELGVVFTYDESGRAYPYSLQASSVVDALRFSAENLGVEIVTDFEIIEFSGSFGNFIVSSREKTLLTKTMVVATGLYSGGGKMGSTGKIYELMVSKGYRSVKTAPAIVQLRTVTDVVRQLKGIKVDAAVKLMNGKTIVSEEYGEVLFCDYGLSGPPILQLSGYCNKYTDCEIRLDLMPEYSFSQLDELLNKRVGILSYRNCDEFLTGLLNKRLGQIIIKQAGIALQKGVAELKNHDIKKIVSIIKTMSFCVTGNTGFDNSQVTAGGLDTNNFYTKTMMSKRDKGVFVIGEILDVYGDCGGFNLQWAWSSALCAGDAITEMLGGGV